ncbi:hypothetical protein AB0K15_14490 [Amycolatopsis sp. NPDC049253]|uniref:hypothetical protein n=1 Tax=Amycolatopsis sp. NPDC049253 TaxID=3155274 RepID=UPI00342CB869
MLTSFIERWTPAPAAAVDWLRELSGDDGLTGFMPPAMPDAAWVLNSIYEHERGPADITYHEHHQAQIAEGVVEPHLIGDYDLDAVSVTTGGGLGREEHPGPGWRRLRWADLAERVGDPIVPEGVLPCFRCFPSAQKDGSWPLGIIPPTEGALDRETWTRLIGLLVEHSGPDTPCVAFFGPATRGFEDYETVRVLTGRLADAAVLYDDPETNFSPSNLWVADHSWCFCTDYDRWGTKVAGSPELIEALLNDAELEAVRLPWNT